MQSLVLKGNFRELTNEELYEVNGGAIFTTALVVGVGIGIAAGWLTEF